MQKDKVPQFPDLIGTIDEDEEVEDFSDNSDQEIEFQPSKQRNKEKVDFDETFQFVSSVQEYNKDSWNDLQKYIKRKAKSKTDDKIQKIRSTLVDKKEDESSGESDHESIISDDELKHDHIKVKEKKKKRKNNPEGESFFDEEADINTETGSFYQMNLSRPLLKAIADMKFVHPTPIQSATIPLALLGKDICGCAATGTGKTAAYMLPTLERLLYRPTETASTTRVLVLVPTRELGVQVYQVSKQLAQYTDIQLGLAVGGLDLKIQETVLRKNPDIVIATPGRLIDHLKSTPTFTLDSIEVLILDEADRMLDEYFAEQMKEIIKQCARTRQTMLFSATMTEQVEDLASVSLVKPVRLFVDSNTDVAFNLRQEFIRIRAGKEEDREAILGALVCRTFRENCMIFVRTKKQAHRLHILLGLMGLKVAELHGNLTQPQRLAALEKFKNKEVDILVATDVAARGLDISGVQTVVNFTMPSLMEQYIHRVGRTARAGRAGVSVSLVGEEERKIVKEIIKKAKNPVKSRIIPQDIIEKYRKKVEIIEPKIQAVLQEEEEERLLSKSENQINRVDKLLKGEQTPERPWFQTQKERKKEQQKINLIHKKKQGKEKKNKPEDKEMEKLNRVAAVQARLVKKKLKQKKVYAVGDIDNSTSRKPVNNKRKSHFGDLVDTSRQNAKKLRYMPKSVEKNKRNMKGKPNKKPNKKR